MEVSVLTGSPGPDLYSAWGHTAIRVFDPGQTPPVDWTYNYGTFEFGEGFYLRFMRGELNYRLAKSPFSSLQREYMHFERAILEQPLALSPDDARALVAYLEWNYLPKTGFTPTSFSKTMCSSRVLTVLHAVFGDAGTAGAPPTLHSGVTYREALRPYMHGDAWIETGIDFILGPRADRLMPPCGSSFLPDGLMQQLQNATLDGRSVAGPAEESASAAVVVSQRRLHAGVGASGVVVCTGPHLDARMVGSAVAEPPRGPRDFVEGASCRQGRAGVGGRTRSVVARDVDVDRSPRYVGQLEHALGLALLALALVPSQGPAPPVPVDFVRGRRRLFVAVYFRSPIRPLVHVVVVWAVWLSLDPWKVPWSLSDAAKQEP